MKFDLKKVAKKLQNTYSTSHIASEEDDFTEYLKTGNKAFDLELEGGFPWGYVTELLGFSSSGKSLFIQKAIANAQADFGAVAVLVDRENAYTNKRGTQLNINNEMLLIAKPADTPTSTEAFQFILDSIKQIREQDSDIYIIIGIDSIASFGKDTALEKSDSGRKAKSTHEGLREVISKLDKRMMLLVANQKTFKIGVLYGDNTTSTAGTSMLYYSTVRIALTDFKQIRDEMRGNEVLGNWIRVETIKTRLGPCFRTIFLRHFYKTGIDYLSGYARLLSDKNWVKPKNKEEFKKFKQTTVLHAGKQYSSDKVDKLLSENPELDFGEFPEWKEEK